MEHEPKRGDVRESDGMICWGYTWKDAQGNKRYQWLTPERFAEKMAADKERLIRYAEENAEKIRLKQAEKYQLKREYYIEKAKQNHQSNKDRDNERNRKYSKENAQQINAQKLIYRSKNREKSRAWNKKYRDANKDKIMSKLRERRRNDPMLRLKDAIRGSIRAYLGSKKTRRGSTFEIVGCTPDFLRQHLERQFKPGMTWENYGSHWHVDHRIPLASGNSSDEIKGLSHWTNLQPLEALENIIKSDKIPIEAGQPSSIVSAG